MTNDTVTPPRFSTRRIALRGVSLVALVSALVAGMFLGVRTIGNPDIGYHLAYGDTFLDTGVIVDSSSELYTLDAEVLSRDPALPPGAWIDERGVYRFPNANWLTQIVFSLAHRIGGAVGLGVLQVLLVAGVLLVMALAMRRMGVGVVWCAFGVLLISLTAYERFMLRPELVGYFVLALQFCLLLPVWRGEATLRWWRVGAGVMLQLLLVNLHSYWLLGMAMTLAALAGAGLGLVLPGRAISAGQCGRGATGAFQSLVFRLAVLLGLQGGVSLLNPWGWRLAAFPFQTLMFFRRMGINVGEIQAGRHPWSVIGELYRPWDLPFADIVATKVFYLVLAIVVVALLYGVLHRRWSVVFLMAGMAVVSISLRRNIAPGAILLVPPALMCIAGMLGGWSVWRKCIAFPAVPFAAAVVLGGLSAWMIGSITTHRFYFNQSRADRFGLGFSRVNLPIGAAAWLSEHQPVGRIWTDNDSSSNLYYFTRYTNPNDPARTAHPKVPILTNTWAYPPVIMRDVLDVARGVIPFREAAEKYGLEVAAVRVGRFTAEPDPQQWSRVPLVLELSVDPNWALVYIDALHVVFLRKDGLNRAMAQKNEITPDTLDLSAYIQRLMEMDPVPVFALCQGGSTLSYLGGNWNALAIQVLRQAIRIDPDYAKAWYWLGICHARMGRDFSSPASYQEAERCICESLRHNLKSQNVPYAQAMLERVRYARKQLQDKDNQKQKKVEKRF